MRQWWAAALWTSVSVGVAACSGGSSGSASLPAPPGNDNVAPVARLEADGSALFNAIAADAKFVYACTAVNGLRVAKAGSLEVVAANVAFPDGKGCGDLQVAPDGLIFATGQRAAQTGAWIMGFAAGVPGAEVAPVESVTVDGFVEAIAVDSRHVYASLGARGIRIYERGATLVEVGSLGGFEQALGLAIAGAKLLVTDPSTGLVVVDVSDPTAPAITGSVKIDGGTARRVVVDGDMAYVAGVKVVAGINIAGPPTVVRPVWTSYSSAVDLDLASDGILYVANTEDVAVLDATDPTNLSFLGSEVVPSGSAASPRVLSVSSSAGVGYAAEWSGIWALTHALGRVAPDIRLDRARIEFGFASLKKGKGILAQNLGNAPLEITAITTDDPVHFTPELSIPGASGTTGILAPGEKTVIEVTFEPEDENPVAKTLTIVSNDPDEPTITIPLIANESDGIEVGRHLDLNGEFEFSDSKSGNVVTIKGQLAGKAVAMAFFATWCSACVQEMSELQAAMEEMNDPNAAFVGVAQPDETVEGIEAFRQNYGITFDIWFDLDDTYSKLIGPGERSFPISVVLDKDGVITYLENGYTPGEAVAALKKALAK